MKEKFFWGQHEDSEDESSSASGWPDEYTPFPTGDSPTGDTSQDRPKPYRPEDANPGFDKEHGARRWDEWFPRNPRSRRTLIIGYTSSGVGYLGVAFAYAVFGPEVVPPTLLAVSAILGATVMNHAAILWLEWGRREK